MTAHSEVVNQLAKGVTLFLFFPFLLNVKSLTERLIKMKDWAAVLEEDKTNDDNLEMSESENGMQLGLKS